MFGRMSCLWFGFGAGVFESATEDATIASSGSRLRRIFTLSLAVTGIKALSVVSDVASKSAREV